MKLDPDYPEAYHTRIFVRNDLGQAAAFRHDLDRCDSLIRDFDPGAAGRLRVDAWALLRFVGDATGIEELRRSSETAPEEITELRRSSEAGPEDITMRYLLAVRLKESGRGIEALAECEAILARDPDHLLTRLLRINLLPRGRGGETMRELKDFLARPQVEELFRFNVFGLRVYHKLADEHLARGETGRRWPWRSSG